MLVIGVCDYIGKNGFFGVLIGLLGGVDLVLVLVVVCDVFGFECVCVVMMLLCFMVDILMMDVVEMVWCVGVCYDEIVIVLMFDVFCVVFVGEFVGCVEDVMEENI